MYCCYKASLAAVWVGILACAAATAQTAQDSTENRSGQEGKDEDTGSGLKIFLKNDPKNQLAKIGYSVKQAAACGSKSANKSTVDFYSVLPPGSYELTVNGEGHRDRSICIIAVAGFEAAIVIQPTIHQDFEINQYFDFKEIKFARARSTLAPESHSILDQVAALLKKEPKISRFEIAVHTDSGGKAETNFQLTEARANEILGYLIDQGIDASRLEAVGYGSSKPLSQERTQADRIKNRRVEFLVREIDPQISPIAISTAGTVAR